MKKLTDCATGCSAVVVKNEATGSLKQRLLSFGIIKGAKIKLVAYAPGKSSVEIKVGKMSIALRKEEADLIGIEE